MSHHDETKKSLRAQLETIEARITELTKPPAANAGISFGKRVGDGTTQAIDRFTDVGIANELVAVKARTERALAKFEEGSYGICDSCEAPIAAGRLQVAPESALCISCARSER